MKRKRNPKPIKPARTPGPVTNRRMANKPLKPARAPSFLQRGPANACPDDDDPRDLEVPDPPEAEQDT